MRFLLVTLMATVALTGYSNQAVNSREASCAESPQVENLYAAEVWKDASPPEITRSVIVISVSINSETKLFLRARDSRNFELVRGSLKQPVADTLMKLKVSQRLPKNPYEASKLLPMGWEATPISAEQFAHLHRSFTSALGKFIDDAQSRSHDVLVDGGRVSFHTTQYEIGYSNDGYENVAAIVDDVPTGHGPPDPLVAWVHQLLILGPKTTVTP
jgi:hypothetical protein